MAHSLLHQTALKASLAEMSSNGKPAALAAAALAACAYAWHLRKRLEREQQLRKEERRGRTRAEAALRNLSKQRDRIPTQSLRTRQVAAIGHVETPFVKRSGTPRQGMVCPSSRGVVKLDQAAHACLSRAALDGLEDYSHIWLLFEFHANTDMHFKAAKVAPPRGYGAKVGWLATRAPHRAVPVGLSLVKVDSVDAKNLAYTHLGFRFVSRDAVWDISPRPVGRPKVQWYPTWVSRNDVLEGVRWEASALEALRQLAPSLPGRTGFRRTPWRRPANARRKCWCRTPQQAAAKTRGPDGAGAGTGASYRIPFAGLDVDFRVDESRTVVVGSRLGAEDGHLLGRRS